MPSGWAAVLLNVGLALAGIVATFGVRALLAVHDPTLPSRRRPQHTPRWGACEGRRHRSADSREPGWAITAIGIQRAVCRDVRTDPPLPALHRSGYRQRRARFVAENRSNGRCS